MFNIEFPNKEERDKFEKQEKLKRLFQYTNLKCDGGAMEDDYYDCTYAHVWVSYGEPPDILKRCKKNHIKIIKFLSVDLSNQSGWFDEIKQESWVEEE